MRFECPDILYLLWVLIPLGMILHWLTRRRWNMLTRFAGEGLLKEIAGTLNLKRRILGNWIFVIAMACVVIALARPQWGFRLQEVKRQGVDILLAVDTSKSMLTQDVKPNRFERTKLAVRDLVKRLKGDRVGLIAFAGDAFAACPLTNDYAGFLLTLEDVNISTIPRGGTNLSSAIREAVDLYKDSKVKDKAVVILTDGEDLEGDSLAEAAKAKEAGIKIYTVGIGTQDGELIQIEDASGKKVFLKDQQNNFVKSRLNEALLEKMALSTGGLYVRASGAEFGLGLIYDQALSHFEEQEFKSQMKKMYFERFQWPLAAGILFLILETCLITRRKGILS